MTPQHEQEDFLALFHELEARCKADPTLEQEWAQAQADFLGDHGLNAHALHRFREWFLLERDSEKLGAPPVVAWAPEAPLADSIWDRVLDSFYGIFQGIGSDQEGYPLLEDLWSGRQIRLIGSQMNIDDSGVMVGRVAVGGEEHHVPFTGAAFLIAPGLADALAKDLSSIRAKQPRSRLSQQQCEALLMPYRQNENQDSAPAEDYQQLLTELLKGQSKWSLHKVLHLLKSEGLQETLDQIAFDSNLDLEAFRHCLHGLTSQPTVLEPSQKVLTEGQLNPADVLQALEAFAQAQDSGKNTADSFTVLEQQLGLEVGSSDPYQDIVAKGKTDETPVGNADAPGSALWLATFLWEQEREGKHPEREVLQQITAFLEFLRNLYGRNLEVDEIQQHQLLAYFCQAKSTELLATQLDQLENFLHWLVEEQGALVQLDKNSKELIQKVVRVNQGLSSGNAEMGNMALVLQTDPLIVGADAGDNAEVQGWPMELDFQPGVGDALRGQWRQGKFHIAGWFPKALMPEPDSAENE